MAGEWEDPFDLKTVAVHASLLPNGKILYWGRRENPKDEINHDSLNEHKTKAFTLDLIDKEKKSTPTANAPVDTQGNEVNLFCSGHCFQPDGHLLVLGGHHTDGHGIEQACTYDPLTNKWSAKDPMNWGRWYPTVVTLSDGSILSMSGNRREGFQNVMPQIWRTKAMGTSSLSAWETVPPFKDNLINFLYPRLHLNPRGGVFVTGPQKRSAFLDVESFGTVGTWSTDGPERTAGDREYAPSVVLDSSIGRIMYIGGGNPPTNAAEIIELNGPNGAKPQWSPVKDMTHPRRQHNGTMLPDGTVFVNGGTQGEGFNNLEPHKPVHEPELYNPVNNSWTPLAPEKEDRCYHSVTLLLPDGRVLSAGGGEWQPDEINGQKNDEAFGLRPNLAKDSLTNAQLFKPPYLLKGPQPKILDAPSKIIYGQQFEVVVGTGVTIAKVSLIGLGSVTHSFDMNQSFLFLENGQRDSKVSIKAPDDPQVAPPGHYMLFLLNNDGVPSVAPIIHIGPDSSSTQPSPEPHFVRRAAAEPPVEVHLPTLNKEIITEQDRPAVVVGLTPICPYGLGACWGGAFEGLNRISDIEVVRPLPSQADSVAYVYLKEDILPDIDVWRRQFKETAHESYTMRGIEITLSGAVTRKQPGTDEQLTLAGTSTRSEVTLAPFQQGSKIEWDRLAKVPKPASDAEIGTYKLLCVAVGDHPAGTAFEVTGTLQKHNEGGFSLEVRKFEVDNKAPAATSS